MKKKWAILIIVMIGILVVFIGCQKRESTKEEVYIEFQKKISQMNYYKCEAQVEVVGNKSAQNYTYIHTYNKPNNYKIEVISPNHLKGKTIEYKNNKIIVKNPNIDDLVELPNIGKNNQYMFIGDFIKNSLQNEEMDIKLFKESLVLQTNIPGEDEYFNKQVLYVSAETKNPTKMKILDIDGNTRFTVNYKDFEYKK